LRVFRIENKKFIERIILDVHDFGINCMSAALDTEGEVFLATGGDDQQINVLKWINDDLRVLTRWYAHSSCIKGISMYL
jgi:WD40 repeat protein